MTKTKIMVKTGFIPISIEDYVELHRRANPGTQRSELRDQRHSALSQWSPVRVWFTDLDYWLGSSRAGVFCLHHRRK
jgi:hypothetical protein